MPGVLVALIAVLLSLAGCRDVRKGGESGHHHEVLQMTAYEEGLELYVECSPLAVGEKACLEAHFTSLEDFKPLTSGIAEVTLSVGGCVQTASAGIDGGVLELSLEPEKAGEGHLELSVQGTEFSFPVIVYATDAEADEAAEKLCIHSGSGVSFPKEKSWKVDFATAQCRKAKMAAVIRTVGRVSPLPTSEYQIVSRASGIVRIVSDGVLPGATVNAGQQLFFIESAGMIGDNLVVLYEDARSEYIRAKNEYERREKLVGDRIVTEAELGESRAAYEKAGARFKNIEAHYSKGAVVCSSPADGYLADIHVSNGQYVEEGATLACVSSDREVLVTAEVLPKWAGALKHICGVTLSRPGSDTVHTLDALGGKVLSVGRGVSDKSSLVPLSLRLKNDAAFVPGTFLDVNIEAGELREAVVVPSSALVEESGDYFVYVQLTPVLFEKIQVETGESDGLKTEIKRGLTGSERIVTKGAVMLKLSQSSGSLDPHAGHVH